MHGVSTYLSDSVFHATLSADRAGADPRTAMIASATTFRTSNALFIPDIAALNALFPGFGRIDDYLRVRQRNSDEAALKSLIEGPLVLDQPAATYVADPGYADLKSQVWDNLFALTILGADTALRTEEVRILRLLNVIEKIAVDDPLMGTGPGIFSAYMSMVVLPGDVFPMPDVPLPTEPTTRPEPPPPPDDPAKELDSVKAAYDDVQRVYDEQVYKYRQLRYPQRKESDPNDSLQKNVIDHDPLALSQDSSDALQSDTRTRLTQFGFDLKFVYMPRVHELFGAEIRRLGRLVNASSTRSVAVSTGGALIALGNECVNLTQDPPCKPFEFVQWPGGAGHVRPIGIADLKVVRTQLYKYEPGEVAHVENVLRGEKRTRTFRDLYRQESTLEQEQETTVENERETQTTERFEVHQEAANVVQQDQARQAGVSVSARYGPVSGTVSAGTSSSSSQSQSTANATTYAKDVMERAVDRVIEKNRTRRSVTTIVEQEETTGHSFDNTTDGAGGTDHVVGVYTWLDKVYYNRVVNYGRRVMFEFMVPEPAAFHLFAKLAKPMSNEVMEMPPPFDITSFEQITPASYDEYAIRYGATGIQAPPTTLLSVQAARDFWPAAGDSDYNTWREKLEIPQGYTAIAVRLVFLITSVANQYVTVSVGGAASVTRYENDVVYITELSETGGTIPVILKAVCHHWAVSVQVFCKPSAEAYQQWQADTFAALKTAYDKKVDEYNRWLNQQMVNAMVTGNNPAINREVERTELKKHCIESISGQRFESFDAMRTNVAPYGYPEFSFSEAAAEGRYIRFFEQGFEWEQITYHFYPYYWARKREWVDILQRNADDPLFMDFLQAGAARVLVPVRPGFEKAILHYLNTGGEIWNGEDVPMPDDPLYVSIIDEIMEADGYFEGGVPEGDPWLTKVPTSLVYLHNPNSPGDLPDYSGDLPL